METFPVAPLYLLFLIALISSAFFSGTEAALLSVQRYKIRSAAARGVASAQRAAKLAEHPENFLPTVLVGNNVVNTVAATIGTLIAVQTIPNDTVAAVVAATVVAIVLIIFGETLPKTLAARNAEAASMALSAPLLWIGKVLAPVVFPLQRVNRFVIRLVNPRSAASLATQEELKVLISLNRESGGLDETQARMLLRTLRLADLKVREVMTPRTEMNSITDDLTVAQFLEFNARQYHSRFPVFKRGTDDVVGILAARDVFRAMASGDISSGDPVNELMEAAHFVWESKPVVDVIAEMQRASFDMVIVVDEFGAVEGLVTFHHLLTQVVGYARQPQPAVQATGDTGAYSLRGSLRTYEVAENLGLELPEGDYDTLGGFVISRLGRLPRPGDKVTHGRWEFEVAKMAGPRVVEVSVTQRGTAGSSGR
jgi:putative hemolysin